MENKVNIICHRGFWKKNSEQNKIISIKKAIDKYSLDPEKPNPRNM